MIVLNFDMYVNRCVFIGQVVDYVLWFDDFDIIVVGDIGCSYRVNVRFI